MIKKLLLLFFAFSILSAGTVSAQWIKQTAPAGTGNLYSVFAISPYSVAASGFQGIWRSFDGGITWANPFTISSAYYYELHTRVSTRWYSLALNTGWYLRVDNPGNAGILCCHPDNIYSLNFYSPSCGAAVGTGGKIVTTCDTGNTFQNRTSPTSFSLYSLWFGGGGIGCACGATGTIVCTYDGGTSWANATSPVNQNLNGIHFPNSNVGYIVGNSGTILKTTNAGLQWTVVPTGIPNDLNGVFFLNSDTGYVVGSSGLILETKTGGQIWSSMNSNTFETLHSINFISPGLGWAVGENATILRLDSGLTNTSTLIEAGTVVNVFPNPVIHTAAVSVTLESPADVTVEIADMTGRKLQTVFSGRMNDRQTYFSFDAASLARGLYMVTVDDGRHRIVSKFLKD